MKPGLSEGQRAQVSARPFDPLLPSSDHRARPFCFTLPFLSLGLASSSLFFLLSNLPLTMESLTKQRSAVWAASHQRGEVSKGKAGGRGGFLWLPGPQ